MAKGRNKSIRGRKTLEGHGTILIRAVLLEDKEMARDIQEKLLLGSQWATWSPATPIRSPNMPGSKATLRLPRDPGTQRCSQHTESQGQHL